MARTQHIYALFESSVAATRAYAEVQARGCSTEHCSVILHEGHIDESDLRSGERATREGAVGGALAAGTAGVLLGGLAGLGGGLLGVGPLGAAALGGGVMAAYGALLGGIWGSDEPEKHLRGLKDEIERGRFLLAIETDDPILEQVCERVFEKHGGRQLVF